MRALAIWLALHTRGELTSPWLAIGARDFVLDYRDEEIQAERCYDRYRTRR